MTTWITWDQVYQQWESTAYTPGGMTDGEKKRLNLNFPVSMMKAPIPGVEWATNCSKHALRVKEDTLTAKQLVSLGLFAGCLAQTEGYEEVIAYDDEDGIPYIEVILHPDA